MNQRLGMVRDCCDCCDCRCVDSFLGQLQDKGLADVFIGVDGG